VSRRGRTGAQPCPGRLPRGLGEPGFEAVVGHDEEAGSTGDHLDPTHQGVAFVGIKHSDRDGIIHGGAGAVDCTPRYRPYPPLVCQGEHLSPTT
jgi:hypothetical protein